MQESVGAPKPKLRVHRQGLDVSVAQGDVTVETVDLDVAPSRLVLIGPGGEETVLAGGSRNATWNTSGYENGYYTVEARETDDEGREYSVASARVLVENPRSTPAQAIAAVATGATLSAVGGVAAARGVELLGAFRSAASGLAAGTAEDRARLRTQRFSRAERTAWRSILLVLAATASLAFFRTFADRADISSLLVALPIAFVAAFLFSLAHYGAEWSLARAAGSSARFKFWIPGALSLALSSLLFRNAFGYPGYVSESDRDAGPRAAMRLRSLAGARALAFLGATVALSLPFLFLGVAWSWRIAEFGVPLALMTASAAAMPFRPMPGADVFAWRKGVWLVAMLALVAGYLLWMLALLPVGVLFAGAMAGAVGYVTALRALRRPRAAGP